MNGPIAQLVALTCYGNAALRRVASIPRFFPDNSTCRFCDRVSFADLEKPLLRKPRETPVAATPDEWFTYLTQQGALGVRLSRRPQNRHGFPDRMTAGLVGGGGEWVLGVRYREGTSDWMARWEVWNRDAPERRLWRATYLEVARRAGAEPASKRMADAREALHAALSDIHAFSAAHDYGQFTASFAQALESLDRNTSEHGYHKDLCVPGTLPASTRAVLDAAQSAWLFGGMGSWNDLGFEGEAQKEYEEVSDRLFSAAIDAICSAADETDVDQPNTPVARVRSGPPA